jgi:hypothetical protein
MTANNIPEPDQPLCERCHQRPATVHICCGNTGETEDLCQECYEQDPEAAARQRREEELIRDGTCKYCGAPAETGSFTFDSLLSEEGELCETNEEADLLCEACSKDLAEFEDLHELPERGEYSFDDKVAMERRYQQLLERERQREQFMKERIANRKSKDAD